jgi:hypothetical protein
MLILIKSSEGALLSSSVLFRLEFNEQLVQVFTPSPWDELSLSFYLCRLNLFKPFYYP